MQSIELDIANVTSWLLAGKVLSAVALVVVLVVIVNIWRRASFPAVSYGSIELSHGRMRWLWFTLILGALALGSAEDMIARLENTSEDEELLAAAESRRQTGFTMPFPFYRYERQRVYADGELAVDNTTEGFLIPWALLSTLLAYLVLVIRWNPENRLALRILQGKRRRGFRRGRRTDS
jgi:hypothetical protein